MSEHPTPPERLTAAPRREPRYYPSAAGWREYLWAIPTGLLVAWVGCWIWTGIDPWLRRADRDDLASLIGACVMAYIFGAVLVALHMSAKETGFWAGYKAGRDAGKGGVS